MSKKGKIYNINLGPFPIDIVNNILGLDLDEGDLVFTSSAQNHAKKRHPSDFPVIFPHLSEILNNPMYLGDDLKNPGKIEFVSKIPNLSRFALVAVKIEKDELNQYIICSVYLISQADVDKKRNQKTLQQAYKKRC